MGLRFHTPLIEPDVRISRIRLSDWFYRIVHESTIIVRNATLSMILSSPSDKVRSETAECSTGPIRPTASIPTLGLFRHTRKSGPFPRPALPGVISTTSLSATPDDPACPSRESSWEPRPPIAGASRVACRFLFHACRRHYPGGTAGHPSLGPPPDKGKRHITLQQRPSPLLRRVGSHITRFEACSTFTHVRPACSLTSQGSLFLKCFSPYRYLHEPPQVLPAGATSCRVGFAPTGNNTPFTAHWEMRVSRDSQKSAMPAVLSEHSILPQRSAQRAGFSFNRGTCIFSRAPGSPFRPILPCENGSVFT